MSFIKFLGTAGARFVMIRQLRSSAGIWISHKSTNIIVDPGPGSIVKVNTSKPKLDPCGLDAIILTHKHLDHSNDVNVMIEAMTEGGFRKRGVLFAPSDSFGKDGVVLSYFENHPQKIVILKKGKFSVGDIDFEVPIRNVHSAETYGLKFFIGSEIISFFSDTKYFDDLIEVYKDSTVIVLNVVFYQKKEEYEHLSLEEAVEIIKKINPHRVIMTHFGMTMLKHKPRLLEEKIRKELKKDIKFAYDGMTVDLSLK